MTPEIAQFTNRGMNQDISVSKATNEFAFKNHNIRITAVNDNTLLSITNEKLPGDLIVDVTGKKRIPNKITIENPGLNAYRVSLEYPPTSVVNVRVILENDSIISVPIITPNKTGIFTTSLKIKNAEVISIDPNFVYYYGDEVPTETGSKYKNIFGVYLGHAILNEYLVLFTKSSTNDYIYVFTYDDTTNTLVGNIKYEGNLNFSLEHPIETLPYYESEDIQKVYWVDGLNQPRVINIVADDIVERLNTQFDFNPTVTKFPDVTITKEYSGIGLFPAGVIQYFISYYNKFGAETGIVWSSDLKEIKDKNIGNSPSDNIICNFKLEVTNVDTSFEYMRVYSMQRTSLNTTPICRIVKDVSINKSDTITVIDTNTNTETIDPTQLLFLGGDTFIASTLTQKDDVLFLGDLIVDETESECVSKLNTIFENNRNKGVKVCSFIPEIDSNSEFKHFKFGNIYRVGVQLQYSTGKWSTPIFIEDIKCEKYIYNDLFGNGVYKPFLKIDLSKDDIQTLFKEYGVINFRGLIVEPDFSNRNVLAQGIVSPTVFNYDERVNNSGPYSIGSWVARPVMGDFNYSHLTPLGQRSFSGDNPTNYQKCEIQNVINKSPINEFVNYALAFMFYDDPNRPQDYFHVRLFKRDNTELPIEKTELYASDEETLYYNYYPIAEYEFSYFKSWFLTTIRGVEFPFNDYKDFKRQLLLGTHIPPNTQIKEGSIWYSLPSAGKDMPTGVGIYSVFTTTSLEDESLKNKNYYVDSSILTFHSPEITNNQVLLDDVNLKVKIVGLASIDTYNTDILLQTKTSGYRDNAGLNKDLLQDLNKKALLNKDLYVDTGWNKSGIMDGSLGKEMAYYLYLWNKKGSIIGQTNNTFDKGLDGSPVKFTSTLADLEHKVIANKAYSNVTRFFTEYEDYKDLTYDIIPRVFNYDVIQSLSLNLNGKEVVYQGNYEKVVSTDSNAPYKIYFNDYLDTKEDILFNIDQTDPVHIKYSKPPHLVFGLYRNTDKDKCFVLPKLDTKDDFWINNLLVEFNDFTTSQDKVKENKWPWLTEKEEYTQESISKDLMSWLPPLDDGSPYFYVVDIYRDTDNPYGDYSNVTLQTHKWIPVSDALPINREQIMCRQGDTYYQRWECLNTVPTTEQDLNSVVDIVSFMVETYVNLEGRYDKNKDSLNILNARETNFNLINPVYSQTNNYFTYNILDEKFNQTKYGNQVTFSLQKTPTSEIDTWCNITLASAFNLNGLYGKLTKLINVNDSILAFQDKALSVINFNNRTALSTESGVPIEIANSGKVNGHSVISSNVGCQNKQSICQASSGVYFIDDYNKAMYGFNKEGLSNISSKGMSMWFKKNLTGKEKIFYDSLTNDVYITNANDCLVFNEGLQSFTSFMDYNNINALFNFNGYSLMLDKSEQDTIIPKKMFYGDYTNNYSIEYKINSEPLVDKTFGNIEFIADCVGEPDIIDSDSIQYNHDIKPFDLLEVWNEYQRGTTNLHTARFKYPNSEKKFRIWRVDIPRDDYNHRDRIRNPWVYLKLSKSKDLNNTKMVFHNLLVKYYK